MLLLSLLPEVVDDRALHGLSCDMIIGVRSQ
jgi:hypothetical protein